MLGGRLESCCDVLQLLTNLNPLPTTSSFERVQLGGAVTHFTFSYLFLISSVCVTRESRLVEGCEHHRLLSHFTTQPIKLFTVCSSCHEEAKLLSPRRTLLRIAVGKTSLSPRRRRSDTFQTHKTLVEENRAHRMSKNIFIIISEHSQFFLFLFFLFRQDLSFSPQNAERSRAKMLCIIYENVKMFKIQP